PGRGRAARAAESGVGSAARAGARGGSAPTGAGPAKVSARALARVQIELAKRGALKPEQRRAHFVSALVIAWPDGHQELFEGRVFGTITEQARGASGFGYDPIFQPDGHDRTFGEMGSEEKHGSDWSHPAGALSHRARAFQALAAACLRKPA
ncbi:MAG: non-canonical purine NTP pyrophosphatase, partial [Bosea sp. (in: a-proteobacteria)]|uniref:non-canonical purine NTP pyrophosphatase n=1 Tax=Bosea sp. (in: a-proteobacteria) TaxID=1871050 RepID=UPI003F7B4F54